MTFRKIWLIPPALLVVLLLSGCAGQATETQTPAVQPTGAETAGEPQTLQVMTHDSFAVSEEVVAAFEQENNADVVFLPSGDTGAALNRAILTRANPLADVFYGVDNTFLSRALSEELFQPYASPVLADIPDEFKLDPENRALPVDYGDVCLNYDIAYFEQNSLPVPETLEDLTGESYRGLLVTENPATSSPGLAFLLATVEHFGEDGYQAYWESLRDNGLVVVNDWNTAYYTNFSASSGQGEQPLVVSYASSPAAEIVFADPPREDAPTAAVTAPGTCFRQVEFVGILQGAAQPELAQKFIDFMLSPAFQEDIPLQMFVYPVNSQAQLPEVFTRFAATASQPAQLTIQQIDDGRERWIQGWTEIVLP